jgi:hypothetical protein
MQVKTAVSLAIPPFFSTIPGGVSTIFRAGEIA